MNDITALSQTEINDALAQLKQLSEYPTPSTQYARVLRKYITSLVEALEAKLPHHNGMMQLSNELVMAKQRITELESRTVTEPQSDYFASLVAMARVSADKAMRKFPQPNYVLLKVAEEAGEVVQAGVHYAEKRMKWEQVEGEIVQLLAMLIRLVTEGDQINGVTPPAAGIQVIEGEGQ